MKQKFAQAVRILTTPPVFSALMCTLLYVLVPGSFASLGHYLLAIVCLSLLPVLAYYGTQRIWVDSKLMTNFHKSLMERNVGYEECLEPSSSYSTFGKWFEYVTKCAQSEQQYSAEVKRNVMLKNAIQNAVDV